MKFISILIFLLSASFCHQGKKEASVQETTVYYFIRHADKDLSDSSDPNLTEEGKIRTENWVKFFDNKKIDFVFSTDYNRTQQTASPIAKSHHTDVVSYDPQNVYDAEFQNITNGKTSVIVGHSNTIPDFINTILEKQKYTDIDDKDYGKLFMITVKGNKITDSVRDIN